jgi:hypothetical protein
MNRLNQAAAAARRGVVWLLPAGRRDWVAAVWAEAHEVPPGLARLAWRAGGVWVLAREALMPRRIGHAALFAAVAGAAAWAAWPQPTVGHAAVSQFHVIATVLLLVGLPLLARRFFGPPSPSRAGRSLRVFCCAAILALMPTLAIVETFANLTPAQPAYRYIFCIAQGWSNIQGCNGVPGRSTGGPAWSGEIALLLMTIGYVGVILFLTSRRSQVTRGTLAIGAGTGLLFGMVMYVVAPLGLSNDATDPWLPGCIYTHKRPGLPGGCIQDPHRPVVAAHGEPAAIRSGRHRGHRAAVAGHSVFLPCDRIPDPHCPVAAAAAAGGEPAAVRCDRHREHRTAVAGQDGVFLPAARIPDSHRSVAAAGGEPAAVRRDRHCEQRGTVAGQDAPMGRVGQIRQRPPVDQSGSRVDVAQGGDLRSPVGVVGDPAVQDIDHCPGRLGGCEQVGCACKHGPQPGRPRGPGCGQIGS